jgi:hypothetical protein
VEQGGISGYDRGDAIDATDNIVARFCDVQAPGAIVCETCGRVHRDQSDRGLDAIAEVTRTTIFADDRNQFVCRDRDLAEHVTSNFREDDVAGLIDDNTVRIAQANRSRIIIARAMAAIDASSSSYRADDSIGIYIADQVVARVSDVEASAGIHDDVRWCA